VLEVFNNFSFGRRLRNAFFAFARPVDFNEETLISDLFDSLSFARRCVVVASEHIASSSEWKGWNPVDVHLWLIDETARRDRVSEDE